MDLPPSSHPTDRILYSYGLGRLDAAATEAVDRHLEACPECRRRAGDLPCDSFLGRLREVGEAADAGETEFAPPAGLAGHPDYRIRRELGRGGMGVVYLVANTLLARDEVLKVIGRQVIDRPGVLERFQREIRAVANLRHPNIVAAYSACRIEGGLAFAMEYVRGIDFARLVKERGPIPTSLAVSLAQQAAKGLRHAHERDLVHRDVKPHNLMLTREAGEPLVKILDFGLAKAGRGPRFDPGLTHEGQALGTPDYIAPEQILNATEVDARADVYSLGATLYFMLAARPPFRGSLYDVYQAHISQAPAPLDRVRPEVPARLAAVVSKMMAKDPSDRFQTPGEVAEALESFSRKRPAPARRDDTAIPPTVSQSPTGQPIAAVEPLQPPPPSPSPAILPLAAPVAWEGLIDLRDRPAPLPATAQRVVPARHLRKGRAAIAAAGFLAATLCVAAMLGVFRVRTLGGTIVFDGLPDGAIVMVDGVVVTLSLAGVSPYLTATAERHGISIKSAEGATILARDLTIRPGSAETIRVAFVPTPTPPTEVAAAAPSDDSPCPAGSVWVGTRTYRRGAWAGTTVSYEIHILSRNGGRFVGRKFDNGTGRNRIEIEGEVRGSTILWSEKTERSVIEVRGKLDGDRIELAFSGGIARGPVIEGDGGLKRR